MPKGLLSRMIFESGAFPLMPDRMLAPWNPEKSYVGAVGLLRYRNDRIASLGENTDSYSEFQDGVDAVRSTDYGSEEVQAFVENKSSEGGSTLSFMEDVSLEQVMSDGVDNIRVLDVLPSFFASFIIYYLIGAVSVQGNKELVEKLFEGDKDVESF